VLDAIAKEGLVKREKVHARQRRDEIAMVVIATYFAPTSGCTYGPPIAGRSTICCHSGILIISISEYQED
jgi:hypothetical protein